MNKIDISKWQNEVLYLHGNWYRVSKSIMKESLDKLDIKWTVKSNHSDITKIITTTTRWTFTNGYTKYITREQRKLYTSLGTSNIFHPKELMAAINNKDNGSLSEYSEQIMTLLKTLDEANVKLAISLMEGSNIEDEWIPWILINKEIGGVRDLMRHHNISPGQWRVSNTKWNFRSAVNEVMDRLRVPKDKEEQFIIDFYKSTKL